MFSPVDVSKLPDTAVRQELTESSLAPKIEVIERAILDLLDINFNHISFTPQLNDEQKLIETIRYFVSSV